MKYYRISCNQTIDRTVFYKNELFTTYEFFNHIYYYAIRGLQFEVVYIDRSYTFILLKHRFEIIEME